MKSLRRALPFLVSVLVLSACGNPGPMPPMYTVDVNAANANAGCEAPTQSLLVQAETMLPGRECLNCHKTGGESPNIWTAAGTVFGSGTALCNPGGLAGVKVEILDMNSKTQATYTTDAVGNFYFTQKLTFPIRARVSKGSMSLEMVGMQITGDCASCHTKTGAAGARIYLN